MPLFQGLIAISPYTCSCYFFANHFCLTIIVEPLALYGSYKLHSYRHELQETRQQRGQHCIRNLTDYQSLSFVGATMDMTLYLTYKAAPTYYYFKDKNRKYCYKYTDKKLSLVSEEKDVCNIVKSEE